MNENTRTLRSALAVAACFVAAAVTAPQIGRVLAHYAASREGFAEPASEPRADETAITLPGGSCFEWYTWKRCSRLARVRDSRSSYDGYSYGITDRAVCVRLDFREWCARTLAEFGAGDAARSRDGVQVRK